MKKHIILLTAVLGMGISACTQSVGNSQISGHLDGIATDTLLVLVQKADLMGTERADTVLMDNGNFSYTLEEKELRNVIIKAKPFPGQVPVKNEPYMNVLMLPGEHMVINGTLEKYVITGSAYYDEAAAYEKSVADLEQQIEDLQRSARALTEEERDSKMPEIQQKLNELSAESKERSWEYIKKNPDSNYSAYLSATMDESMDERFATLTDRVRNGVMKPYIQAFLNFKKMAEEREQAAAKIVPGIMAPEFTLTDINGRPLALSSLRGKYLVLDFWGSWCSWCIKGFPEMKNYYTKYKDKVEFLGIACGDTEEKWKAAVKQHEAPWLHVISTKENDVSRLYAIRGFPTKIIIDPQGKIVKVVVGESPEFYACLDELFK